MNIFTVILYNPMFNFLMFLVWLIPGHQVGWAIVILTTIIRLILMPVTVHTARVQVRMRTLQPKIDALRDKHKGDKTLQSQALMALYKEEGVSPFSSCLPMIVQLVVLIVLYQVFRNGLSMEHVSSMYSFLPKPTELNTNFFGIDLAKPELWILPILAAVTQFWQTKITMVPSSGKSDDPTAAITKQMIYFMPLVTLFIARGMPAALPLYWIITSLFTVAQQEYVIKRYGLAPQAIPAVISKEIKKEAAEKKAEKPASVSKSDSVEHKKGGVTVTVRRKSN